VNYYHMDCTLSGHPNHSEPNKDATLFSSRWTDTVLVCIWNVNDTHLPSVVDWLHLSCVSSGPTFCTWTRDWLSWGTLWFSSASPDKCSDITLNLATAAFFHILFLFTIHPAT
jgi:hypothetical protein